MIWREQLELNGFAFLRGVFSPEAVAGVLTEWAEVSRANADHVAFLSSGSGPAYGARIMLELWPNVVELVRVPGLRDALRDVLGEAAGVARVLYFDKPPGHSWALPWHKDYTIAVEAHSESTHFTKPTVKAGVPHVVAPKELLDRMLTVRVHLDDATEANGALRVIPGTHRSYHQKDDPPREAVTLNCGAGDVLLMRPLLTHASGHSKADANLHRRIVHLECAADPTLPEGHKWRWFSAV